MGGSSRGCEKARAAIFRSPIERTSFGRSFESWRVLCSAPPLSVAWKSSSSGSTSSSTSPISSPRWGSEGAPLLETEACNLLKVRPVRPHDGRFPFFEHLSLADQRVIRISVSDDRRVLARGRRRGQQPAQRGISSRAPDGLRSEEHTSE